MNLSRLEKLLQSFYKISGMDIAVVDLNNKIIARRYPSANFCNHIHKSPENLTTCNKSDDTHLELARKTRETVTYTCPYGIFEAISPIMDKEEVVAYLFLGMAIEDDDAHRQAALESARGATASPDEDSINKMVDEIPRYSKETLEAFAEMLPVLAEYIENNNLIANSNESIGLMAKGYIKSHLSEKITLSKFASHLHCSTVTLTEHLKEEFGMTVMEYVLKKRMQMATRLLADGYTPIHEVAEACGFSNIEYFSKTFKKYYGLPPKEWRHMRELSML